MASPVDDWFDDLPACQRDLLVQLRRIVLDTDERLVEELKWNRPVYSLNALVCYLQKARHHVVLGFQQGAHIDDPSGLLIGTGKTMRHVKFLCSDDIDIPSCRALIEAAIVYDHRAGS